MNYQDKAASSSTRWEERQPRFEGAGGDPAHRRSHARLLRQPNKNDSIRAAYLANAELAALGRKLGAGEVRALPEFRPFDFIARQKEDEADILKAYRSTREATESGEMITPAAEWLLDNHYLVEENIRQVARDLPLRFYRQLPVMDVGEAKGLPRALALAWLYVAHTHSTLGLDSLTAMVEGLQEEQVLSIGELWALPSILRFVLIENLSRISRRVENARHMRRLANTIADSIQRASSSHHCRVILEENSRCSDDNAFAAQLLYRLRDGTNLSEEAISWLEDALERRGTDAEDVLVMEHNRLSFGNATMGAIIRSLRKIDDTDWTVWFETVSRVDRILRDHSGFARLDFQSRDTYRDAIERLARRSGQEETFVARTALDMAQRHEPADTEQDVDVGHVLVGPERRELEKRIGYRPSPRDRAWRLTQRFKWRSIAVPTLLLVPVFLAFAYWLLSSMGVPPGVCAALSLLFFFPATEAATGLYNTLISLTVRPARLVGYEFKEGVPASARTLLVVPCLISNRDGVDEILRNLEVHYLANTGGEISFAILSDWTDSDVEESEADRDILAYAEAQVDALSKRYAFDGRARFFLLHRRRLYNPAEGVWMGWERKRGKLHELNLMLRGDKDTTYLPLKTPLPDDIRYVMTLDADTRLTRDAVTKLAGKLAHPLNRPVIEGGRVTRGYGILQPRVTPSLTTGHEASAFQRIFSVNRGLDPYVFTVSDVYQDIAEEGSFTGKGLYHVDAFEAALAGRIPENAVLSHDLLEGSFARSALVTDVELVEDFPVRYQVEASRQHRWARGDWQLLPFIFGRKGVSPLGRWKMIDNLRRSLTPIFWLIGSIAGWMMLPLGPAVAWQMLMVVSLFVAPTLGLISGAIPRRTDIIPRAHLQSIIEEFASATAQVVLRIVFIAHTAWVMADAIARSLYRLFVSRRKMLEWRTAAQAHATASMDLASHYRSMWQGPAIGLAAFAMAFLRPGNEGELVAVPFCLMWALSPLVAWFVSRTAETEDTLVVSDHERTELRKIARRTWSYFDEFVTDEHNHLPPDNFQEDPEPVLAGRTSPTNIGIYLLSVISARDFGWISFENAISRLEHTVATIGRMEKHRGHLYNWYDTKTLAPLHPKYVSSVDSGNLAGHLIAVSSACREWADAPAAYLQSSMEGIEDVAGVLAEGVEAVADDRRTIRPLRRRLDERVAGFRRALEKLKSEPEFASIRTLNLIVMARDVEKLATDLHAEIDSRQTAAMVQWAKALTAVCEAHVADAVFDPAYVEGLRARLSRLRERTRDIAFTMDFRFLLRGDRRLLSIGYRVEENELDEACYDLLASEARLTSLFGIAKGDLPTEHWFRLGRPIVPVGAHGALVSWSGSMFEYLMPPLVMQERQGSILNQSNNLIVRRQMEYGESLNMPWGISEAAFNARDPEMTYQYSNFGVPSLGLKRGLGENAVVAPYATVLASQYRPTEAVANLERLRKLGALGRYGFYDAVDFTPSRLPEKKSYAIVRNYMAHHHGMSIAAIANVVFSGRLRDLFHSDPVIEAAELLLQEKAPREVPVITIKNEETLRARGAAELRRPELRIERDPLTAERMTVLLSNGHYSTMLTATGSGYSKWNGLAVTRWQPDPTEDRWGSYVFLRDSRTGEWWSATAEPKQARGEQAMSIFADDKAEFYKTVGDLRTELECVVAVESDAEARRLTIFNNGKEDRFIEVTSFTELVIAAEEADQAHPAFSKMFVRTEIGPSGDVIYAERKKRSPDEPDMHVAHLVIDGANTMRPTEVETDRRAFVGRGRTIRDAAAFDPGAKLSGSQGFTLDPCMALRRGLRIPAGKRVRIIFWTLAAPSRAELEEAVARYRHADSFTHEMMQAWTRAQVQARHVGITSQEAADFQRLARYLIYPDLDLRAGTESYSSGLKQQSALWPLGISGDYPICVLRINDESDLDIARKALLGQEYLRARGLVADLVIINERASSYIQDMQTALESMCENARLRGTAQGPRQHIFAVRHDLMSHETYEALLASARIVLHARNGKLATQIERVAREAAASVHAAEERAARGPREIALPASGAAAASKRPAASVTPRGDDLVFWNGYGGFSKDGSEYVVRLAGGSATPHPWINVVSNGNFGFHVAAEGGGHSWSANSRDYQLTPWTNDPVTNRPGEAVHLVDFDSATVISPFATFDNDPRQIFETRHGQGYSIFSTDAGGLNLTLTQLVDPQRPLKLSRLRVENGSGARRRYRVYLYAEWVLGNNRGRTAPFILPGFDEASGAVTATNPYSLGYAGRTAFLACDRPPASFTTSRREYLGRHGSVFRPAAVYGRAELAGVLEPDGDPCAAIAVDIVVEPGRAEDLVFAIGDAGEGEAVADLARLCTRAHFEDCLAETRNDWARFLGTLQVDTPDDAMNFMVNRWLPYQGLACRIQARAAFYQASGAYGFRDQLQDTLAFMLHDAGLARRQILNAAGRQFKEGDVQHWWLPGTGAGVRTMIADDVVWLAYAAAHYVEATGDAALLEENLPFLEGPPLEPGQHDNFFQPATSAETATVYEHCARALDLAVSRTGEHGLPLILGGDWNDGMNRVGDEGRGESVWLGWFLAHALDQFAPHAKARGDRQRAEAWAAHRARLKDALETAGWDGSYYRRGYYDDGAPLGSSQSAECRIDSIAQSWSVLSGAGDAEKSRQAMDAVLEHLVDREAGIIRLFTPPFTDGENDPGYIKGYPPGVRENGGQYTHAATWVAYALARMGRGDEAYACFDMLNPVGHARTREAAERYRVEPYVVAADVYCGEGREGRGGWTWYTGSGGWLYRAAVEAILGIRREGKRLVIEPMLPSSWPGYKAKLRIGGQDYAVEVSRKEGGYVIGVNEKPFSGARAAIELKD